ncbi:MAG: DEAD/DEAH box helicase [Oligoflexales bacterium]
MEVALSPSGRIRWNDSVATTADAPELKHAFSVSNAEGLLNLANRPELRNQTKVIAFWYEFVCTFMQRLSAYADTDPLSIPSLTDEELIRWINSFPPSLGAEHMTSERLLALWDELSLEVALKVSYSGLSVRSYVRDRFPKWADVGRIHFHIAENRKETGKPFAFLATFTIHVPDKARVQHRPLGFALKDSALRAQKDAFANLLKPIHKATESSELLTRAFEDKSIFSTMFLDPNEAYELMAAIPKFEDAGIVCKVPEWWRGGRPPPARVVVKIGGDKKKSRVGFDSLVDFDVKVAVGDESLTEAEIEALLRTQDRLTNIRGRWVEVDRNRLGALLSQWQDAMKIAGGEGMPLAQALRLLSGFRTRETEQSLGEVEETSTQWIEVLAGKDIQEVLAQLRSPKGVLPDAIEVRLKDLLKGALRPYQAAGVKWLNLLKQLGLGGCLADDMGLGKTIQVISLLLSEQKKSQPALLVVPSSLLANWQAELQKFAPTLSFRILHPSFGYENSATPPKDLVDHDVLITSYGMTTRMSWLKEVHWDAIVIDEAQAIKNASTKQSRAIRILKGRSRFALTGTPVENNLGDLWSLFDFACPGLLGSMKDFDSAVKAMESKPKRDYGPLRQLIGPYILRRKKTDKTVISDLPDKIELPAYCGLTMRQLELYKRQVDDLAASLKETDGMGRKGLVLSSLMKLKQICNHPSQYLADNVYAPQQSGKFAKLKMVADGIAQRQEKLLVFTQFRELTDILAHYLSEIFVRQGLILHGGTPVKKRQDLVNAFQSEDGPPFLVLSLKAGGTGLNLTAASHVVHFDRWWNPAVENQATDRAFRIGQKNNVIVNKFICRGTIEEKIDRMIADKRLLADSIVDKGAEINLTELSNDELLELVKLDLKSALGRED